LGLGASARAIASCCCWPAREVAAAPVQHLLEHREQLRTAPAEPACGRLVGQAHAQVLLDREPREDLAPLRHEADAGAGALVGRGVV
jgi:hypothetical protein